MSISGSKTLTLRSCMQEPGSINQPPEGRRYQGSAPFNFGPQSGINWVRFSVYVYVHQSVSLRFSAGL